MQISSLELGVSLSLYLHKSYCLIFFVISLLPPPSPGAHTHTHTSQTSSANQEADSDWPEGFHPAEAADYSCALGSCSSSPAGQDNHHPAPADHCAACGQTNSGQHPTSAPSRSEPTLQHVTSHHTVLHQTSALNISACSSSFTQYFGIHFKLEIT